MSSAATAILALPRALWGLYVDHLWNYERASWVGRVAAAFRVMAFLLIMPFAILTMLDVASYVIARTIGVIDATKASTGGAAAAAAAASDADIPSIHVSSAHDDDGTHTAGSSAVFTETETEPETEAETETEREREREREREGAPLFGEEGPLRLAGVDAFSPAPSQPSSPTLARKESFVHGSHQRLSSTEEEAGYFPPMEAEGVRKRTGRAS